MRRQILLSSLRLFLVPFLVLGLRPALASSFLAMSSDELVASSDVVVEGTVESVRSFWNPEKTLIFSRAQIRVDDAVLGDAPAAVLVQTVGGQVGTRRIEVPGFPAFARGERVLVFLVKGGGSVHHVVGYRFGQYRIETGLDGVERALPTIDGDSVVAKAGVAAPPEALPLAELKDQLRAIARRVRPEVTR